MGLGQEVGIYDMRTPQRAAGNRTFRENIAKKTLSDIRLLSLPLFVAFFGTISPRRKSKAAWRWISRRGKADVLHQRRRAIPGQKERSHLPE